MDATRRRFVENVFYYAFVLLLVVVIFRIIPWFWPFLGGLLLAYLFKHLSDPIVRCFHVKGKSITAIIGVLFYGSIVFLFWSLATLLAGRALGLAQQFPQFYRDNLLPAAELFANRLMEIVAELAPTFAISVSELFALISSTMGELVTGISSSLLTGVTSWLKAFPIFLIGFVFMIVSSFYIGMDYTNVSSFILYQIPKRFHARLFDIKEFVFCCLGKIIKAYLIILFITFLELSLGLWALRIENFWSIAALIAVLDILPLIGSGGVILPWSIYHLITGHVTMGIGLLLLYGVISVVRNIVEPKVIGDQLGLHPVVTLAAMFCGLKVFGFWGIFIAPIAALLIRHLNQTQQIRLYKSR